MSRPTAIRALGAAALTAALTAATALLAVAAPSAPEAFGPPPALLTALQRDLGLSVDAAKARLAREARGQATEAAAQRDLGAAFAGAWFDPATGKVIVGTTDPARADAVRAAGAEPRVVQRDARSLDAKKAELDARATSAPDAVTGWYVDPASNSVVVSATDPAAGGRFASGMDGVRVEQVAEQPRPLADLVGGDAIYAPNGERCSIGFNATRGSARYVITAGHCTDIGGTWSGYNRNPIGPVEATSFPGNDYGIIRVDSPGWTQTGIVSNDSGRIRVTGSTPAVVGASTCRSGSSSGYRCGTIQAVDQTVNYGGGDVVYGLTRTSVCSELGDSGGPFVSGNQAQGVTSGGSGGCLLGGETFFQPVNEALSAYGLALVTG